MKITDNLKEILKFGIVGGLGTATNLLFFFIGSDVLGISANIMTIICFIIAVTQNYIFNHKFTFAHKVKDDKLSFVGYFKFVSVSLLGLLTNILILNLVLYLWPSIPLKTIAQGIGIIAGMGINFIGSKYFVFKRNVNNETKA